MPSSSLPTSTRDLVDDAFFRFACELNAAYRDAPALWELDYDEDGFEWVEANGEEDVVYAFLRRDAAGSLVLCALNLSDEPVERTFRIEGATSATVLIDTDWLRYGGATPDAEDLDLSCDEDGITVDLPSCSGKLVRILADNPK